jgi:hypothetical protein
MKAKIEELETNSKLKNVRELYRGINDFRKRYQPRTNIVKDEQGDLVVDCHSILARWRNYFSQVLNVHGVDDFGQAEIHTAELPVSEPSVPDIELAIEKLKSHKSPGIDQIPAELIKAGVEKIAARFINLLFFGVRRDCLREREREEWKKSIIVPIYKKGDKTDCNNYRGISLLPPTYKILSNILL